VKCLKLNSRFLHVSGARKGGLFVLPAKLTDMHPPVKDLHRRGQIFVALAAVAWSFAGVLQRGLKLDIATQAATRSGVAFLALAVVVIVEARRTREPLWSFVRAPGWPGVVMAVCSAGASASFIFALNRTSVASVLFIQALTPLVAVVLARVFLGERASRRAWLAMSIAVAGVALMVGGPKVGSTSGLIAALVMSTLFATTIVLTRFSKAVSMTPASALSQLLVVLCALPFAHLSTVRQPDLVRVVLMGVFQMGLGQLCFIIGARLIAAAETGLITLLEVVLGPLWVWIAYSESPGTVTVVGGLIVVGAVVIESTERTTVSAASYG
jgi:drug/metabolite transporter (DMT)-like permease